MVEILNTAHYLINVKLGDEIYRFPARGVKTLPKEVTQTREFELQSNLIVINNEIKSQKAKANAVDNKLAETKTKVDAEKEEKPKVTRKRKGTKTETN